MMTNAKKNATNAPTSDPIHQFPIQRGSAGLRSKPAGFDTIRKNSILFSLRENKNATTRVSLSDFCVESRYLLSYVLR